MVYEGEKPEQISRAFAHKFGLSESLEFHLREQLTISLSKSNLGDESSQSREPKPEDSESNEDVPPSDDDDHPSQQLQSINSLDRQTWSNGKKRLTLNDSRQSGFGENNDLIRVDHSISQKTFKNPGERLYDIGRQQHRLKQEALDQQRHKQVL